MSCVVYKIYNDTNSMVYIGSTEGSLEHRFRVHKSYSKRDSSSHLHKAMAEIGVDKFHIEAIANCSGFIDMAKKESYFIETLGTLYPNGYNKNLRVFRQKTKF